MTSEIDKLKHYTTIRCKDDKEVTLLCKYVKNKHIGNCPNCIRLEDVTVELEDKAYEEMRHN